MPYASNAELPTHIRKLSKNLQDIWRKSFNSAYKQYNDESKAFAIANAVMNRYKEKHSMDFDSQFSKDIGKFFNGEKKEKERINDNYGEDFTDNLSNFLRG